MVAIELMVNGEKASAEAGRTLAQFIASLNLDPKKVAVERNLEIVPKSEYEVIELKHNDQLEIVHFVGGG